MKKKVIEQSTLTAMNNLSNTKVTKEIIDKAKNLKLIGRAGAGVDNIDLAAAKEKNIIVMNTPGGNTNATAIE